MRYVRIRSLSWWAGFAMIVLGALSAVSAAMPPDPSSAVFWSLVAAVSNALAVVMGDPSASMAPGTMIAMGLAVIGLRDKMERTEFGMDVFDVRQLETTGGVDDEHYDVLRAVDDLGESPLPPGIRDPFDTRSALD